MKSLLTSILVLLLVQYNYNCFAQQWQAEGPYLDNRLFRYGRVGIGNGYPNMWFEVKNGQDGQYADAVHIWGGLRFKQPNSSIWFGDDNIGKLGSENGNFGFWSGTYPALQIRKTDGFVGIGTMTPQSLLSLGAGLNNTKLALYDNGPGSGIYGLGIQGNQFRLHVGHAGAKFSFLSSEAGSELMTIQGNGNVGIGTISPLEKLSITGNIRLNNANNGIVFYGGGEKIIGTADYGLQFLTNNSTPRMIIRNDGSIGIGTTLQTNPNNYKLAVKGTIGAQAVKVEVSSTAWSDYVFLPEYKLRPLYEVEHFIKQNHHLPEVPSAEEIEKEGIDVAQMDAMLLKKIEELTLYMIEQNKKLEELKKENEDLKKSISHIRHSSRRR
jgi:hypothetical protein